MQLDVLLKNNPEVILNWDTDQQQQTHTALTKIHTQVIMFTLQQKTWKPVSKK